LFGIEPYLAVAHAYQVLDVLQRQALAILGGRRPRDGQLYLS